MTEWERTGNTAYRDKIIAGMKSISALPHGIFTGPGVLGFDPATGVLSYEGDPGLQRTEHLTTIMGGFQVMNELMGNDRLAGMEPHVAHLLPGNTRRRRARLRTILFP